MVTISVIIPVYNACRTLERCLDSLLMQTFRDFEVVLINDGSTDDSLSICQFYGKKDNRIVVFSQDNKGVSTARNQGIEKSSGKYICFVDSDDSVEIELLEKMLIVFSSQKSLVIQGFKKVTSGGEYLNSTLFPNRQVEKKDFLILFNGYDICSYGFSCSKLFSRQLIIENNIKFVDNLCFSEDLFFLLDYLLYAELVVFTDDANYLYYTNAGSLSFKIFTYDKECRGLILFVEKMKMFSARLEIPLDCLLLSSHKSVALFIDRVVLSIYVTCRMSKVKRIICLQNFGGKYRKILLNSYVSHDLLHYLFKQTIKYKFYHISDYIMRGYLFLRKIRYLIK